MTTEQTGQVALKTVSMFRYKNVSPVALSVPELNAIVPKDGYSAPMPSSTPTLDAYVEGKLMVKEAIDIPELANESIKGVVQGGAVTELKTAGPATAIVAGPAAVKLDYIPVSVTTNKEKLNNYDQSAEVAKAIANTVVSVGTDLNGINQFGEIPNEEATRLVRSKGASTFSTEVNTSSYVADEAQKIIASASGVVSNPPTNYPVPEGVPADIAPFFQQPGQWKKIFIYKTTSAETLLKVKNFERDANVLSCIDQRLAELGR